MSIIHCQYCQGWITNKLSILREHQYTCKHLRRQMVKEAIAKKGVIYPAGSKKEDLPINPGYYKGVKFVEDKEYGALTMWFDFGQWIDGGRSTTVMEKKL